MVSELFELLSTNVLPLISLLFLYGIIWFADQGQDLLITLNGEHSGPLSLYLVVVLLAVINWYYPKFSQEKFNNSFKGFWHFNENTTNNEDFTEHLLAIKVNDIEKYKKFIPRFLGTFTILLVALGIANAQEQYLVDNPFHILKPGLGLVVLSVLYYIAFATSFFEKFYYYFQSLYLAICLTFFLLPFVFWYFNGGSTPNDLIYLVYGFSGYALLFAMVTSIRTLPYPYFLQGLKQIRVLPIVAIGLIINILYFLFFFFLNVYQNPPIYILNYLPFLSFSVMIAGLIVYYVVFTLLIMAKYRTGIRWPLFLIVFCFVININSCNNFHQVRTICNDNLTQVDSLETYATNWLNKKKEIGGDTAYPIFIINTYGGGIRAAAWTSFVVSYLDSITDGKFQEHIFAYSGASGGTIGASVLCANGFNKLLKDSVKLMPAKYRCFYQKDFLTPVLTGMVGNDVIYSSFSIPVKERDRGAIQEITWEKQFQNAFGTTFYSQNIDSL
ncbi:MAG: hypothetical protein K2Q22_03730, partial [Cytophagales bacterium]|nr:hypothetical protein [Cytophagales bacterium]